MWLIQIYRLWQGKKTNLIEWDRMTQKCSATFAYDMRESPLKAWLEYSEIRTMLEQINSKVSYVWFCRFRKIFLLFVTSLRSSLSDDTVDTLLSELSSEKHSRQSMWYGKGKIVQEIHVMTLGPIKLANHHSMSWFMYCPEMFEHLFEFCCKSSMFKISKSIEQQSCLNLWKSHRYKYLGIYILVHCVFWSRCLQHWSIVWTITTAVSEFQVKLDIRVYVFRGEKASYNYGFPISWRWTPSTPNRSIVSRIQKQSFHQTSCLRNQNAHPPTHMFACRVVRCNESDDSVYAYMYTSVE